MSETTKVPVGLASETSGSVENTESQPPASGGGDSVPKTHLEKVLKESKNKTLRIQELETDAKQLEDQKLIDDKKWKEIADQRLDELNKVKSKVQTFEVQTEMAMKMGAVKKHLVQMGLKSEHEDLALNKLLDVSSLLVDPDTGAILGAEDKAKEFRKLYTSLGIFGKPTPGVNQDAPASGDTTLNKSFKEMTRDELKGEMAKTL